MWDPGAALQLSVPRGVDNKGGFPEFHFDKLKYMRSTSRAELHL